jgi:hypothetical protein
MFDLPSPDPAIEISAFSQGMSKGLRQTHGVQIVVRPEVAVGPLVALGYYKNVSGPADGEAGAGIGLRRRLGSVDFAASALYKWNTSGPPGADRGALELSAVASRRIGPVTPRVSVTWSPDDLGGTRNSLFVEGGASIGLFAGASLSANIARRSRDGGPDYTAFNAGATYAITRNISAELRYYDTAQSRLGAIYEPRLVASIRARF